MLPFIYILENSSNNLADCPENWTLFHFAGGLVNVFIRESGLLA
jgi:hypothetical protein